MITTAEEYLQKLWLLYSENTPNKAILLPSDEIIYEIDLNSRVIKTPSFLSVKKDQAAETIYFLIDRFAGEIDLATTACVIQYKNQAGQESFYPVPFYDISTYSSHTANDYLEVEVKSGTYEPNKFYIENDGNYVISADEYDAEQTYYIKSDVSSNKRYILTEVTEENYLPDKYYYFVNNYTKVLVAESEYEANVYYIKTGEEYILSVGEYDAAQTYYIKENSGTYILDHSSVFNPKKHYYISIDKRFLKAHVEYSNYMVNTYYILDRNNEMVLSTGSYDPKIDYYTLIDKPKILFPWLLTNEATAAAGTLQFSVRFYQIETSTGRLVYNLNTLPASSKILDTMEVEISDDKFEDIKDTPSGYQYDSLGREASVLEDIYFKIKAASKEIYWDEA